eukprot:62163-Pleurochrysis_carterae.AAC.3
MKRYVHTPCLPPSVTFSLPLFIAVLAYRDVPLVGAAFSFPSLFSLRTIAPRPCTTPGPSRLATADRCLPPSF